MIFAFSLDNSVLKFCIIPEYPTPPTLFMVTCVFACPCIEAEWQGCQEKDQHLKKLPLIAAPALRGIAILVVFFQMWSNLS